MSNWSYGIYMVLNYIYTCLKTINQVVWFLVLICKALPKIPHIEEKRKIKQEHEALDLFPPLTKNFQ